MKTPPRGMRVCPTRPDRDSVLFAHLVNQATCQSRQREHYHKCWTCAHKNGVSRRPELARIRTTPTDVTAR